MKNSLIKVLFLLCFVTSTNFGYSEALYYAENTEADNVEGIEYSVDPTDLALISGKLFLNCSSGLVPITNLRYENHTPIVTPKAYVYRCRGCNEFVFMGHKCPYL